MQNAKKNHVFQKWFLLLFVFDTALNSIAFKRGSSTAHFIEYNKCNIVRFGHSIERRPSYSFHTFSIPRSKLITMLAQILISIRVMNEIYLGHWNRFAVIFQLKQNGYSIAIKQMRWCYSHCTLPCSYSVSVRECCVCARERGGELRLHVRNGCKRL